VLVLKKKKAPCGALPIDWWSWRELKKASSKPPLYLYILDFIEFILKKTT
jgi:hypothetical protein